MFATGNKNGVYYGMAAIYVNKGSTKSASVPFNKQSAVNVDKIIKKLQDMNKY